MELSTMVAQATGSASSVRSIPVEWINPGPWQPRRIFDTQALNELAVSIRQKGLIQPILVRETPDKENRYQLIAGERRWRAAQIAKLYEIPAIIGVFDERDASEIALIENVQRRDLTSIEEAEAYQALILSHDYTQEELADIIGKSRSHIANLMRLINLPASVQELISEGRLTMGQVRPLIGHQDAAAFAQKILTDNLSAREVERLIKDLKGGVQAETKKPEKSSDIRALEDRAMQILGLSLSLSWDDAKEQGKLSISMSSLEQLDDLMLRLGLADDSPS
jgi:ParB family chromosome partitioning protein